jgi:hypothetical protein
MSKFKKGDKVLCVAGSKIRNGPQRGKTYTIEKVLYGGVVLEGVANSVIGFWFNSRFVKVEEHDDLYV